MGTNNTQGKRRGTPKQQPRAQITRQNILKAALQEFAQLGLAGARVDMIAARAGVNKQVLYYHFGNKEDLFRTTLAAVYDTPFPAEILTSAQTKEPADVEMSELISGLFKHFRNIEDGTALIGHENRYRGKHLTPSLRKSIKISVSPIIEAIRKIVRKGQREGVFASDVSVDHLYLTLIAMSMFYFTYAYTLSAILERNLLDKAAVAAWKDTVEKVVLASIRAPHRIPSKRKIPRQSLV
jgi:TetR/AcrR family transcriptional regulator